MGVGAVDIGCRGVCLCVTKPSDLWESLGRSIMANCSATHHQYPRQSCVAGRRRSRAVKNEAEATPSGAWRDAEGDINGGNTGVHWHFSTAWSMRPINPHEDTYRSGTPHQTALQFLPAPKPSQMSRCKTLFIFPNQYLLALKWNKRTYVRFLTPVKDLFHFWAFSPSAFYTRLPWL